MDRIRPDAGLVPGIVSWTKPEVTERLRKAPELPAERISTAPPRRPSVPPSSGATAPVGAALPGPDQSRAPTNATRVGAEPAPVNPPRGVVAESEGCWLGSASQTDVYSFGCASHPGPAVILKDKGNQDFAFAIERAVAGETWAIAGVADGASQSTWAARGARHAAAAFIDAFDEFSNNPPRTERDFSESEGWVDHFAEAFHGCLRRRLSGDYHYLLHGEFVDPTWDQQLYRETFLPPSQDKNTDGWFQSTLLAVALGPVGGFGLFLGDGYYRIDRDGGTETHEDRPETHPATLRLLRKHIVVTRLQLRGTSRLGVVVATDGVSKSAPDVLLKAMTLSDTCVDKTSEQSPLKSLVLRAPADCARFLGALSKLPNAELDNMSIAFATRRAAK